MLRPLLLSALILIALPHHARAGTAEIRAAIPDPASRGAVTFRWFGLPLYDATLYTAGGNAFDWRAPLALKLVYAREIPAETLVRATLSELRRMEGARADHAAIGRELGSCFRDVGPGDRFTATATGADAVTLWFNGARTCTLSHAGIRERFLGIWLSDDSRSARLSRQLRGE